MFWYQQRSLCLVVLTVLIRHGSLVLQNPLLMFPPVFQVHGGTGVGKTHKGMLLCVTGAPHGAILIF